MRVRLETVRRCVVALFFTLEIAAAITVDRVRYGEDPRVAPANAIDHRISAVGVAAQDAMVQREVLLWKQAVAEAGLDSENISAFGKRAAKFPKSWVDRILGFNQDKRFRFNFMGSGFNIAQAQKRAWVVDFARTNFGAVDYLRFTDIRRESYKALGEFDHSLEPGGFRPLSAGWNNRSFFDEPYFEVMAASNFTLCPGGDASWSMRFYEAALAGSLPVIESKENDLKPPRTAAWLNEINYTYATVGSIVESLGEFGEPFRAAVAENRALFLRYQTFLHGDNTPPVPS